MMRKISVLAVVCGLVGLSALFSGSLFAYATYAKWSSSSQPYYINPVNLDVSDTAAEAAIQVGASSWGTQSAANFKFTYAGRVNDTATAYDGRNVVLFRNTSNGAAIATTYSWSSGGVLQDADIVLWDGAYTFYTGTSGCSGGAYIEDVTAHEFGHALGMSHSSVADATMYPSYSYCSTALRSLASDDIAGVQSLYPSSGTQTTNTAPTVAISSPASGGSFLSGSAIPFSGSASDSQDGNISSRLVWKSSLDGQIGTGASFSKVLTVGSHVITASVTDSGGLSASSSVTITVVSSVTTSGSPYLSAKGYKVKGKQQADLSWSGLSASSIDVYRNGNRISTVANTGAMTDPINLKGAGSYSYTVCGAGTSTCSNTASVVF